jgi:hypothetical protein
MNGEFPLLHRLVIVGLSALLGGCVLSVDEVIPESGATFDPRLLGAWQEVDGSDRAVVSRIGEKGYAIEYSFDGRVGNYQARLGRLGERLVLDVWPAPGEAELPSAYAGMLVGGHLLLAVDVEPDQVQLAALEPDAFAAALRAGIVRLPNTRIGDRLILHGMTEELRAALGPYMNRAGTMHEPDTWRRVTRDSTVRQPGSAEVPCYDATAWSAADLLFRRDPRWLGADGAGSVELGRGRTLWLFSDTWIDPSGRGSRRGARMVSNTLAIQSGQNPTTATVSFHWGRTDDGSPAAFFPDRNGERLWFGSGVRLGDRLVLFLGRIRSTNTGLGFESVGWTAFIVDNPDSEPSVWTVRELETPANPLGVTVGFAAAMKMGDHLYAFGSLDPVKSHPIYAVRWSTDEVQRGNLRNPEWWTGNRLGWVPDSSTAPRWPLFENGASELTIHADGTTGRFIVLQAQGFGPADVVMRAAPALTGPWTGPRLVYRPPEYNRPNVMIYAAKAHPQLTGADLVVTYATNTFQFSEHLSDSLIYYPRFVRLSRCR